MNREEILKGLVAILKENQKEIGEDVDEISETMRPIGDLGKFDSLTGVMVTVRCYEKFDILNDEKMLSLFVGQNTKGFPCALTVGEIADRILTLTSKG